MTDQPAGRHTSGWMHQPSDPLVRQVVAVVAILLAAAIVFAVASYLR